MTRHELMTRMSGWEMSCWAALFNVKAEEKEHAQHMAESGDGVVIYDGFDRDEPEDYDDEDADLIPDGD